MVNKYNQCLTEIRNNMRDGEGDVILKDLTLGIKPINMRLCSEMTINQGCSIGEHIHESETEIYYCISGSGTYIEDRIEHNFEKGDTAICNNGHCHSIKNENYEPLKILAVIVLE